MELLRNKQSKKKITGLEIANNALVLVGIIAFVVLVFYCIVSDVWLAVKIVVVCTVSFVAVTIFRKILNVQRPQVEGAIYNKKTGESFPSRHTFSMMMIGLSWLNVNFLAGMIICGLTFVLGGIRIEMGAHKMGDIYGAILIAITCAVAGYFFL